ncbi:MAG: ribose 5-phosphate isomerase B [Ferrimicrobium sp.]|jgi:ribose 5-phosphate isomerase B|uniref:Ribose 5-phosphate isomerase B n=1 Tax=Ferrimicrobium acidiphilum TaxID=121039 RepID=A0ABV3Y484_9ACTN|nr:ribose 5-phosphate isomerase B [Ferrimicrobium sp.]MCL5973730.1 ribose 5-phosphate isomerase B [Actinomycetota bacterium]
MTCSLDATLIAIGSDHVGFQLKVKVGEYLTDRGAIVLDFGTDSDLSVDYPMYCEPVAQAVARGAATFGVVIGGSGQGEQIVANKVPGVRAALCYNRPIAELARSHNDANVLALGARFLEDEMAFAVVDAFFSANFEGGRHARRVAQIGQVEEGVSFIRDAAT